MSVLQGSHFFDRVPAAEQTAPEIASAFVFLKPSTGHYVFADAHIAGWTQVYFHDGLIAPHIHLEDVEAGARTAALFGTSTVEL